MLTRRELGATIPARERRPARHFVPFWRGQLKDIILTKEGYQKLKREIEDLSTRRRREIADRIKVAREFGDIAENAEYDAAKNEQAMVEARIAKLEERLGSAEANPAELKLSNESPVGKAIIGHKKGETIEVATPRGSLKYKILEIKAA